MDSLYKIIANADDFGRHKLINAAVEKGVAEGCLRSATLMPGGAAFSDAVKIAKTYPQLGVGIHFTLVNGTPVLPPDQIPSLVTESGLFYDDYKLFVKRFLQGKINHQEVRQELTAQLAKMTATGLQLSHVDSHQHMHTLPGIIDIVLDLAQSANIHCIRIPKATLFVKTEAKEGLGQLIGRTGLYTLARLAQFKAKKRGFHVPEHFSGIVAGDAVTKECMEKIIATLPQGCTEIMLHPGTNNTILQADCLWQHDFEAELAAITSPAILQLLQKKNVEITNFRFI